jgi:ribosomal subunit interface protein
MQVGVGYPVQIPLQLTFRSMAHSSALETHARRRAAKLERFFERITSCHVVFDLASHRHRQGGRYRISVHVGLPGHELLVSRAPSGESTTENLHATTDYAFDEAERRSTGPAPVKIS